MSRPKLSITKFWRPKKRVKEEQNKKSRIHYFLLTIQKRGEARKPNAYTHAAVDRIQWGTLLRQKRSPFPFSECGGVFAMIEAISWCIPPARLSFIVCCFQKYPSHLFLFCVLIPFLSNPFSSPRTKSFFLLSSGLICHIVASCVAKFCLALGFFITYRSKAKQTSNDEVFGIMHYILVFDCYVSHNSKGECSATSRPSWC